MKDQNGTTSAMVLNLKLIKGKIVKAKWQIQCLVSCNHKWSINDSIIELVCIVHCIESTNKNVTVVTQQKRTVNINQSIE